MTDVSKPADADPFSQPTLRPGIAIVPMPEGVQLRLGEVDTYVLETDQPRVVEALLQCFDGSHTKSQLMEVARALPGGSDVREADVEQLVQQLDAAGLLLLEPIDHGDAVAAYLAHHVSQPTTAVRRLRASRVVLMGEGALTNALASLLASYGITTVAFREANVIRHGTGAATKDAGPADAVPGDLLIAATEAFDPLSMERANNAAITARLPCLFVDASPGRRAIVGPLYVPGEGACWACYTERRRQNAASYRDLAAAEQHARRTGKALSAFGLLPSHVQHIAAVAVGEAVALLAGYRAPRTLNGVLVIDLETAAAPREAVWALPWCAACRSPRDADAKPSLGDLPCS